MPPAIDELDPTLSFVVCRIAVNEADVATLPPSETNWRGADFDTPSSPHSFAPGIAVHNRYQIEREIGRGGMGQVYLARDIRLGRGVALKVCRQLTVGISQDTPEREQAEKEFTVEAQIGAMLSHPAIATVFDFGLHEGMPFTVFEYLEGDSLRSRLQRQSKMSPDDVRHIIAPIAQALDFAHGANVVHRDLKPENIRSTKHGHFKILDLGLAKEFRRNVDWEGFAGTPAYASPEQAAGQPCDGRADQYALALIVFEMLAGVRVFASRDPSVLLRMHRTEEPKAVIDATWIPNEVRSALIRALKKTPNERFDSCAQFATAIGCRFLDEQTSLAEVVREATVEHISSSWLTGGEGVYGILRNQVRLALTPETLWVCHEDIVWRLPSAQITQVVPQVAASENFIHSELKAEAVRLANRGRERHVKLLGTVNYLFSGILLCAGLGTALVIAFETTPRALANLHFAMLCLCLTVSGLTTVAAGWGLRGFWRWGWWIGITTSFVVGSAFLTAASALGIAFLRGITPAAVMLAPAVAGALAGLYFVYLLTSRSGRFLFTPEYRRIVGLTPHLSSRFLELRARTLKVTLETPDGPRKWAFRFGSQSECRSWAAHLVALDRESSNARAKAVRKTPVAVLTKRPPLDLQVLGKIQAVGELRNEAEAGIRIRCMIADGDAVVDTHEEQISAFNGTIREVSGLAVRAVDSQGKHKLVQYWFANRALRIAYWLILLIAVSFGTNVFGALYFSVLTAPFAGQRGVAAAFAFLTILLVHAWPVAIASLLAWRRSPQLALPAALSGVALSSRALIMPIVALMHQDPFPALIFAFDPIQWAMMVGAVLLTRGSHRSLAQLRETAPAVDDSFQSGNYAYMPAWIGTASFTILLWTFLGWSTHYSWSELNESMRRVVSPWELLQGGSLPSCTSPQVRSLVEKLIRGTPIGGTATAIESYREISYEQNSDRRIGECVVRNHGQAIVVNFSVAWLDRPKGQFVVRIMGAELPSCTSQDVVSILEQVIRKSLGGELVGPIEGNREVSYDRDGQRRVGECIVHSNSGITPVKYVVEWQEREKRLFRVRMLDLPSSTSPDVVALLERIIRGMLVDSAVESIAGHREISYDRDAQRRRGQCTIHTKSEAIVIDYVVEWNDRDQGKWSVRVLDNGT